MSTGIYEHEGAGRKRTMTAADIAYKLLRGDPTLCFHSGSISYDQVVSAFHIWAQQVPNQPLSYSQLTSFRIVESIFSENLLWEYQEGELVNVLYRALSVSGKWEVMASLAQEHYNRKVYIHQPAISSLFDYGVLGFSHSQRFLMTVAIHSIDDLARFLSGLTDPLSGFQENPGLLKYNFDREWESQNRGHHCHILFMALPCLDKLDPSLESKLSDLNDLLTQALRLPLTDPHVALIDELSGVVRPVLFKDRLLKSQGKQCAIAPVLLGVDDAPRM